MDEDKVSATRGLDPAVAQEWGTLPAGWRAVPMSALTRAEFAARMVEAAEGDPYDATSPEDAEDGLAELVAMAGDRFDTDRWFAVEDAEGPIGVVLPQVFSDAPHVGTNLYLGVAPERRGRGAGRILHRWGMAQLAAHGATRYVGSTGPTNAPMIAIFRANGCEVSGL